MENGPGFVAPPGSSQAGFGPKPGSGLQGFTLEPDPKDRNWDKPRPEIGPATENGGQHVHTVSQLSVGGVDVSWHWLASIGPPIDPNWAQPTPNQNMTWGVKTTPPPYLYLK